MNANGSSHTWEPLNTILPPLSSYIREVDRVQILKQARAYQQGNEGPSNLLCRGGCEVVASVAASEKMFRTQLQSSCFY